MASFGTLWSQLKLDISDFSNKLAQASGKLDRFAADINGKIVAGMKELNKQTSQWGFNLKSVSRVVSGILISQTFYSALRSTREATGAVWEFTKALETAKVAYSNLFGDTSLASEFINVLKDFAAKTPFSFTEAEAAAKRLLAYGIEYKNVMYVMQGVLSAASIQGDSAKIESISRALGQIYTYGKLMTQEIRQLSEAGIPAYEILQEELGLTQEELANLGHEGIDASTAINALVDGIQKRFGNAAEAASRTATGIISNIKDNATMLFAGLFEPLTTFVKSGLAVLGELMFALRELYELKGAGAVFEYLFPEEMHAVLRQVVANLMNLGQAIMRIAYSLSGLLRPVLEAVLNVFNAFAPVLTLVANVMAELISVVTSNATAMRYLTAALAAAAAMWVVFKVRALATAVVTAVITAISKAIAILGSVLTFVVAHPFWALLIGLTGILVGVSSGFGKISEKVSGLFKNLTQFNGVDPDKVLLPSQKERANDLDKFNNKLEGTSDAMDDLADSTGKATKAAKGLLSFDEAFKLNEPDEGSGNGITDELDDLLEGLEGLDLGSGYIPEIPDFSDYFTGLKTNFLGKLKEVWDEISGLMEPIVSAAIGGAFGSIMGGLLGGKLGGIIGAGIGAIVGYFWNMLADYFGLTPDQKVEAGIIGGIGALIGAVLGGIVGGPLGAKIGAIIGGFVGSFWGIFAEYLGVIPEQHIATAINGALSGAFTSAFSFLKQLIANLIPVYIDDAFAGFARTAGFSLKSALTGALKQGVVGAVTGLAAGMLTNAITAWIADELNLTEQDLENAGVGQIIGNIIGTITGLILGGPMGSLVGGALGQLAGGIVAEFWNYMSTTLKGAVIGGATGLPIGAIVGALVGSIGGPLGAALGAAIGTALGALVGLIIDKWEEIKEFFSGIGETIGDALDAIGEGFTAFGETIANLDVFQTLKEMFNGVVESARELGSNIADFFAPVADFVSGIITVVTDAFSAVQTVFSDVTSAVQTVVTDVWSAISTFFSDIFGAIGTVLNDIWSAVTTVWNDVASAVSTVCSDVFGVVSEIWWLIHDIIAKVLSTIFGVVSRIFTSIFKTISQALSYVWNIVSNIWSNIFSFIGNILNNIWNTVSTIWSNIFSFIGNILSNIWSVISSIFTNVFNFVRNIFINIYTTVSKYITNVLSTIRTIFTTIYNFIKNIVSTVYNTIKNVFSNIYTTVKNVVSNVYSSVKGAFSDIYSAVTNKISDMYESVKDGISNIYNTFTDWISDMWNNVFGKFFQWIEDGIDKLREFFGLEERASASTGAPATSYASTYSSQLSGMPSGAKVRSGHALGGIFDREHVARFAEGNKAEAIIPLENDSAMQPFVSAVADGLTASLAPIIASMNGNNNSLQPLYVGTLIADDRSLKELERRMEVIRVQENRR